MIKFSRHKTFRELETETIVEDNEMVKVSELKGWEKDMVWICFRCKVGFQDDDKVFVNSEAGGVYQYEGGGVYQHCPLLRGLIFKRYCNKILVYEEKVNFPKNYIIK